MHEEAVPHALEALPSGAADAARAPASAAARFSRVGFEARDKVEVGVPVRIVAAQHQRSAPMRTRSEHEVIAPATRKRLTKASPAIGLELHCPANGEIAPRERLSRVSAPGHAEACSSDAIQSLHACTGVTSRAAERGRQE